MGVTANYSIWPLLLHQCSKLRLSAISRNSKIIPLLGSRLPSVVFRQSLNYASTHPLTTISILRFSLSFPRPPYRFLYVAETQQQSILIKFTRRYSISLHDICAGLGCAPRIFAFEQLPGGWYAIAMEYVESGASITRSTQLAAHRDRWTNELQKLMDTFHSAGLVHGDLRDANILCKEGSVMLIDFDWGGCRRRSLLSYWKPQRGVIGG